MTGVVVRPSRPIIASSVTRKALDAPLPIADERDVVTAAARLVAATLPTARVRIFAWTGGGMEPPIAELGAGDAVRHAGAVPWPPAWVTPIARCSPTFTDSATGALVTPISSGAGPAAVMVTSAAPGTVLDSSAGPLLDRVAGLAGMALGSARRLHDERERADAFAEAAGAKSQFLNLVAHDLRGPMTVLMGYLSLFEDGAFGPLPEELAAVFPVVNTRIAEMEDLINAMLETSRLDDGRLELLLGDVDLRDVVAEAVTRSEVFAQPGQRAILAQPDTPVDVRVDRSRLVMVVGNLVQNALKFSVQRTDVEVVVRLNGAQASVAVVDRGIGIEPEDMPTLFTRFGRIRRDPATSGIPGAGLGLYLARELTRVHAGDITAVSTPGAGSTFTLTLPLRSA